MPACDRAVVRRGRRWRAQCRRKGSGRKLEPIGQSRPAIDERIDVMGRASMEAVRELSAQQLAGPPRSKARRARGGDLVWYGRLPGRLRLKERQLKGNKPRLPKNSRGANTEEPISAYKAMQQDAAGERMLQILLNSVSTRRYRKGIPAMADSVGVSKSTVSRETIEASEAALEPLDPLQLHRWHEVSGSVRACRGGGGRLRPLRIRSTFRNFPRHPVFAAPRMTRRS
jgi:hypothetical protein